MWVRGIQIMEMASNPLDPLHEISPYLHVQDIALRVLRDIVPFIKSGNRECSVADVCAQLLEQYGAKDCWYHDVPALVLVGERTTL